MSRQSENLINIPYRSVKPIYPQNYGLNLQKFRELMTSSTSNLIEFINLEKLQGH